MAADVSDVSLGFVLNVFVICAVTAVVVVVRGGIDCAHWEGTELEEVDGAGDTIGCKPTGWLWEWFEEWFEEWCIVEIGLETDGAADRVAVSLVLSIITLSKWIVICHLDSFQNTAYNLGQTNQCRCCWQDCYPCWTFTIWNVRCELKWR